MLQPRYKDFVITAKNEKPERIHSTYFQPNKVANTEQFVIRKIQNEVFAMEVMQLQREKPLAKNNKLLSLSPFIDYKNLLRVGGQLKYARIPCGAKHQIILPCQHHTSNLIIRQEHERNTHVRCEHVSSNLQQRYWIVNGRTAAKRILHQCFYCKMHRAKRSINTLLG